MPDLPGRVRSWLRRWEDARYKVSKIDPSPEWPCADKQTHGWHYWSDGQVGYECPGVTAPARSLSCDGAMSETNGHA